MVRQYPILVKMSNVQPLFPALHYNSGVNLIKTVGTHIVFKGYCRYKIPLKHLKHYHFLWMKYAALRESLVTNIALGFTPAIFSTWLSPQAVDFIQTGGSALSSTHCVSIYMYKHVYSGQCYNFAIDSNHITVWHENLTVVNKIMQTKKTLRIIILWKPM